jgi:hypothetical protein
MAVKLSRQQVFEELKLEAMDFYSVKYDLMRMR